MNNYRTIYFNVKDHKYTDHLANPYTSVTTFIGEFYKKFDTKKWSKVCANKRQYRGMTANQVANSWDNYAKEAAGKGNVKHDYLETSISNSNNFNKYSSEFVNGHICTISDLFTNRNFGRLDLEDFNNIQERYTDIYNLIAFYVSKGYYIYAEIAVYHPDWLICGRIDCLCINWETGRFVIIDWKTNSHPLMYEAGYFRKDLQGNSTSEFIYTNEKMFPPIDHLESSNGYKYSLQITGYANLVEQFGLTCNQLALAHIRETSLNGLTLEDVKLHPITYMKNDWDNMIASRMKRLRKNTQTVLFN